MKVRSFCRIIILLLWKPCRSWRCRMTSWSSTGAHTSDNKNGGQKRLLTRTGTRTGSGSPGFFGLVDGRLGDEVRQRQTENKNCMLPQTCCLNVVSACWSGMVEKNMALQSSGGHEEDPDTEECMEDVETEEKVQGDSQPLSTRVSPQEREEDHRPLLVVIRTLWMTLLCMHDLPSSLRSNSRCSWALMCGSKHCSRLPSKLEPYYMRFISANCLRHIGHPNPNSQ